MRVVSGLAGPCMSLLLAGLLLRNLNEVTIMCISSKY